jgi:hypothetical protein
MHGVPKIYNSYRPIWKLIVILSSSKIDFNQGYHCRLIEYFKTEYNYIKNVKNTEVQGW